MTYIKTQEDYEYGSENRPESQLQIKGVPINPLLRSGFFSTDNTKRPALEKADWSGVPFIYIGTNGDDVRYTVWCLDDGAWDRPSWWGDNETLMDAVLQAKVDGPSRP